MTIIGWWVCMTVMSIRLHKTVGTDFFVRRYDEGENSPPHSTVTDLAKFLGLSISVPRASAA